jgi:hypothetical protein
LEAQLIVFRKRLKQANAAQKTFAEFYGVLAGKVETTEQEIEAAKLKLKTDLL